MDNKEKETEISTLSQKKTSMNKTQNTFLSTGSSNKFRINTLYRMTSPNNTKYLPPIKHLKKIWHKSLIKKENKNFNYNLYNNNYESNNLKQKLSDRKIDMNIKNGELIELKIKNFKLSEENKNIKHLISLVLDIDVTESFTKNEIIEKIDTCTPTPPQKKKLKFVLDFIKLKIDIGLKKEKISELNKQIEYYTKNAKTKILTDLENEFTLKNNHQSQIKNLVEKMKKDVEINKNKLDELKNNFSNKKNHLNKIKSEAIVLEKALQEVEDERDKLDAIMIDLRERQRRIQERIKINRYKNERDEFLTDKKMNLENIDDYIQNRDNILEEISQRKNNVKNLDKEINELNNKINELNKKNEELSAKMDKYNKEEPKLIQKSYEPLSNQKNLQDLEEKLKIFKKEYHITKTQHDEKQNLIQNELNQQNYTIEQNNQNINSNNQQKNQLQNELNELNKKLNEIRKNLEEKEQKIKEAEKKLNDFISEEEQKKKEYEEKEKILEEKYKNKEENEKKEQLKKEKEFKKDIYTLKKQIDIYKDENKILGEENKNLKKEIEGFDIDINQNEDIDEKIKQATEELNQLKPE